MCKHESNANMLTWPHGSQRFVNVAGKIKCFYNGSEALRNSLSTHFECGSCLSGKSSPVRYPSSQHTPCRTRQTTPSANTSAFVSSI